MKKALALFMALMLTASVTACGSSTNTGDSSPADTAGSSSSSEASQSDSAPPETSALSGTISILSWYDEIRATPLLEAFKTNYPDITIDFQYSPPVKDYVEKLSTLLYSDSAPDIFQMSLENREDLIKGDYCLDLSDQPYMTDGTIPDNAKATYGNDGKVYSLAVDGWVGGIFYNKTMFEAAGIDGEPQTWDEFLEACEKLKTAGYQPLMDNCQDAAVTVLPALIGAETYSKDSEFTKKIYAGELTFGDGWDAPMAMWHQLVEKGYINKDMVGITGEQMVTEFAIESVAMIPSGPWNLNTIDSTNPDLNYGCMGIPGKESGNVWYDGAINVGLSINAKTQNKELALAYLEFAATPEGLEAQFNGYGGTIIAKGFSSTGHEVMLQAEEAFRAGKTYIPMGDWLSYTEALRNTYMTSLQDCLIGKITPDQLSKNLDEKLAEMSGN